MPEVQNESLVGIVEVSRQEAQLLLEAGYLSMEMGNFRQANEIFEGVCSLLPKSDVPRIALGQMYMTQNRTDEAIKAYKEALKLHPDSAAAHAFLGEAYLFKNQPNLALPALQKAQELEPEGPPGKLAQSLRQAHDQGAFSS